MEAGLSAQYSAIGLAEELLGTSLVLTWPIDTRYRRLHFSAPRLAMRAATQPAQIDDHSD